MKKLFLIACSLAIAVAVKAQIIHVPDDYLTIQQGINASNTGDTVLVDPGTYLENINFEGKNITVASLFLTTMDTTYISQTIIDGNQVGSVVSFLNEEDSTALLSGFKIMNGYSANGGGISIYTSNPTLDHLIINSNSSYAYYYEGGGGIYCSNSNSLMKNLTITGNFADYGGGIYFNNSNPSIQQVTITGNSAQSGGGLYCDYNSNPMIHNTIISGNYAYYGGGIYCGWESSPLFENITVANNSAGNSGGGIYFNNAFPVFDTTNRSNIYLNLAPEGSDLYSDYTTIDVIVDTFSVLIPTENFAFPIENFSFDILNGKIEQAEADLYVSPLGDDNNSGLTADDPLKTIHLATLKILADSLDPHMIHLLEGTFSPSATGETFPVHLNNYISLSGVSENDVILDAEGLTRVFMLSNNAGSEISNLTITGGFTSSDGGGILFRNSSTLIQNVTITYNNAHSGGGIYCDYYSSPLIQQVYISGNSTTNRGGGIYFNSSNPSMKNVTIINNSAESEGGGIYLRYSNPELENVTVTYNSSNYLGGGIYFLSSTPVFDSINRSNIYLNSALEGNDLYSYDFIDVIVDTFSFLYPTVFFASPIENFSFDILHGKIEQVEADLYVSPQGDDNNTGLTADDPLKTIRYASIKILADSLNPNTIHVLDGTYSPSATGEIFPIFLSDHVSLSGVSETDVILDAEELTRVIELNNNVGSEISNLTITGGSSSYDGGGICSYNSSSTFDHLTITGNSVSYNNYSGGGGVYCSNSNLLMKNLTIINNFASNGGGVFCDNQSNPVIQNTIISGNHATSSGGGIYCAYESSPTLEKVTVSYNSSDNQGGGIYFDYANPVFDTTNRSNIFLNTAAEGSDLFSYYLIDIVVDTFSVLIPTEFFAYPLENFTFDILHGKIEQVEADLYVSPLGDDSNSGLTAENPLKTIHYASLKILADSITPHTIHLLEGTYSPSVTGETFPVYLQNYVNLSGASETSVILDAEELSRVIGLFNNTGSEILNLTITNGSSTTNGGGIYCNNSNTLIYNVTVTNNNAEYGGALYFDDYSNPTIQQVTITDNSAYRGGGIFCDYNSNPVIQNVIVSGNSALNSGGGIYYSYSSPFMQNVTITNNSSDGDGGGIYFQSSFPIFDSTNRCNIYMNNAETGDDLYSSSYSNPSIEIIVDTFTVLLPRSFQTYPLNNFNFDILHGLIPQENISLFASPNGNNSNSGLTAEDPFKTIDYALSQIAQDSINIYSIQISNGIYSSSNNEEVFPLSLTEYVVLVGESENGVTLDAEGLTQVIVIDNTVGSEILNLTITGGFTSYNGGGIYCYNSSTTLDHLTITGNTANGGWYYGGGGGIYSSNSNILMENLTITDNFASRGGGILCDYDSNPVIQNVNISANSASNSGGGIYDNSSNPFMQNVMITNNQAPNGGGVYYNNSSPELESVTVAYNSSDNFGGGIYFDGAFPVFDSVNRSNIFLNYASEGSDLYSNYDINIMVDTFSVLYPTVFFAFPFENFSFDILNGKIEQVETDLYVSPQGDDNNTGLTPDDPLKTIRYACLKLLADSLNPRTIHLLDGTYSPSDTDETFPVYLPNHISLAGASESGVILDAEGLAQVIRLNNNIGSEILSLTITGGSTTGHGGGIYCSNASPLLQNVTITGNNADYGGGIYCDDYSSPSIQQVTITDNTAFRGGGIYCNSEYNLVIQDVDISGNVATSHGGGIYYNSSNPFMQNVTVSNNSADGYGGGIYFQDSSPVFDSIDRCNIYLNNAETGDDLHSSSYYSPPIEIIVDTFTVLLPRSFQAYPLSDFNFDIVHGMIPQENISLFASPDGDNNNSGLTAEDPLKTIDYILTQIAQDSINFYSIQLSDGTYSSSNNEEVFPLSLSEYITVEGESESGVILDAEEQSGVIIISGQDVEISYLTIMGGSTTSFGGGVNCQDFSPTIQNVNINNNSANYGGGIYCGNNTSPVFHNIVITENYASSGGGIYCSSDSDLILQNLRINSNQALSGGGIYSEYYSSLTLEEVNISFNSAGNSGGGIYFEYESNPFFDSINRCNIYMNSADNGDDLYAETFIDVVVDTFTVLFPRDYQAYPLTNFNFDILYGLIPQYNINLYASPDGDNANNGLNSDNPVKTIYHALSLAAQDSINLYTIQLSNGTYSTSTNEEVFPISLPYYTGLTGESENGVILDAGELSGVIEIGGQHVDLLNLTITGGSSFEGGGINCFWYSPKIQYVTIVNNQAISGGGIYCNINSNPIIKEVTISSNIAENSGGGIYFNDNSTPILNNVTISDNTAAFYGGGIYFNYSTPLFDSIDRCNIYLNNAIIGSDLYSQSSIEVIVDTFSVLYPNAYYASPLENFSFDILNGKIELVNADLYVSPNGSNTNSGLTPDDPLQTIRFATSILVSDSLNPHTIYLDEGTYSASATNEFFPVLISSYCNLTGVNASSVILDGEGNAVLGMSGNNNSVISHLTIKGGGSTSIPFNFTGGIYCEYSSPNLQNLIVTNNFDEGIKLLDSDPVIKNSVIRNNDRSGIYCTNSNPLLVNLILKNNNSMDGNGGGLCLYQSDPILQNINIYENHAIKGGGVYCNNSNPVILNSTISDNTSYYGGGIYAGVGSNVKIINAIIWDNVPHEIMIQGLYTVNTAEISYSNIMGGEEGVVLSGIGTATWIEGNIDDEPMFIESGEHPYALSADSPCIDEGTPDTTGLNLPSKDILGNLRIWDGNGDGIAVIDMGAYEFGSLPVSIQEEAILDQYSKFEVRCYPNPFSGSTTFEYELEVNTSVTITILNHFGQETEIITNEIQSKGIHQLHWTANEFPSGIYYYYIKAGNSIKVGKIVSVK